MCRSPCCTKEGLNRGPWSAEEDMILLEYIRIHGDGGWKKVPQKAGLNRCGKSCRLRWVNYLRPDIKLGNISPDEEELILRLHRLLGNRWSLIAGRLPGRTDNEIKNYWNTRLKKKLLMEKSQPETISISSSAVQNHEVYKTNPVGITTAVKHIEMVTADGCGNRISSDDAFKMFSIEQISDSSRSGCNLFLNDSIRKDDSENIAFSVPDVTDKATNSTCSMSRLVAQQSPHSEKFASHATPVADNVFDLNNPSSSECNLLSSPPLWTDFGLQEFYMGLATPLAAEGIEFEDVCYDQNVNSFTFADDQGIEEFDTNSHQFDWIL
eukprot:PITA_21753